MGTRSNRVRHLSDDELVALAVEQLLDVMMERVLTRRQEQRFSRLVRELGRRRMSAMHHDVECVCMDCLDFWDYDTMMAELDSHSTEDPPGEHPGVV